MADLSPAQLEFLKAQRIPLAMLFDASGMTRQVYQGEMEKLEQRYAFGVSQCKRGHESIRTRAGHCIQCNTAGIAFDSRFRESAWVYVAASRKTQRVKIGLSKDLDDRLSKINEYVYGGADDWRFICFANVANAGRVEFTAQDAIAQHRIDAVYQRAGRIQRCLEVFTCDPALAVESLRAAVPVGTRIHTV